MRKNYKLFIPLISAVALLVIVEVVKPKTLNWTLSFSADHKIPFGSFVLFEMLDSLFPEEGISITMRPVYNTLPDTNDTAFKNYLFISDKFNPDRLDAERLKLFIEEGGTVFISAQSFGDAFSDSLGFSTKPKFEEDSLLVSLYAVNSGVDTFAIKQAGLSWYFDKIDSSKMSVLGRDEDTDVNFIKINLGKGQLFIHTVPLAFTNYNFLKPGNADYISGLLSHLPNKPIIWDEYYKPGRLLQSSSPLKFILKTQSLRWAYFLALTGIILFIFVEGKRKQRVIPIIKPLSNDTLNFVDVIGRLYYNQADHTDVALKMRSYLLEMIRHDFNLDTSRRDGNFIKKLSAKTTIEKSKLQGLFKIVNQINPETRMSADDLVRLNKEIETFYKNCRGNV